MKENDSLQRKCQSRRKKDYRDEGSRGRRIRRKKDQGEEGSGGRRIRGKKDQGKGKSSLYPRS